MKQKAWVVKTLFTEVGTIFLVTVFASTQHICYGRVYVSFGLLDSRKFEASEEIEVTRLLSEKFREKLCIEKILDNGIVALIKFLGEIQEVWGGQISGSCGLKITEQFKLPKMSYRYQASKFLAGEKEHELTYSFIDRI